MATPPVVSPDEWQAANEDLLRKEKEATRARAALAADRRRLPMVPVDKGYAFEGPNGEESLLDLFEGRHQLIVYRFFFEPGVARWPESGCEGCSVWTDNVGHLAHLHARDTSLVLVSPRAAGQHRAVQRAHGLDDPLVDHERRLLQGLRRGGVGRSERLSARGRPGLSHLLRQR